MTTEINYDERGRAYTLSPPSQYQVEDARPTHFIKDPRAKKYYETHGRWVKLYTHDKVNKRYYLPRSAYSTESVYNINTLNTIQGDLRDYQYESVKAMIESTTKGGFVRSGEGTGKALENNEPVLTENGRKPIKDIVVGEKVFSQDGTLCNVIGVFPQGKRDIYKVTFIDGTYSLCDGNHIRSVTTDHFICKGKPYVNKTTLELMNDPYLRRKHGKRWKNKWYIPTVDPIQFKEKSFDLDPYLLGVLLGDGYMKRVSFSSADKEILERVSSIVSGYGMFLNHYGGYDYQITSGKKWKGKNRSGRNYVKLSINKLGLLNTLSHTKFIPKEYLYGSVNQRLDLLRGLMDTDGFCDKRGSASYTTSSYQLALDVQELIRSLGGITSIRSRTPKFNGKEGKLSYTLSIRIKDNPFYLKRKYERYKIKTKLTQPKSISSIEYYNKSEATCIKIDHPSELFITRDYIVTHNTRCMRALTECLVHPVVIVVPTLTIQRGIVKGFAELGLDITPVSGGAVSIEPHTNYVMHQKTFLMHYDKLNDGCRYYIQDECHHAPQSIIDAINLWKSNVFGFTASPLRGEFKEEGFKMLYGTMYETGKESLPVKVIGIRKERTYSLEYAMKCKGDLPPDSYEIYRNMLNNDITRLEQIVNLAIDSYNKTKKIIIFCDRIDFADNLYNILLNKCQHTFKITGETSKANIPKQVENLEDFIIVGSIGCCGEGLDIPSLNTGILTFNTSNLKTIRQAAGRVRRNFGSKTHGYFIDIMDVIQIEGSKKYYGGISARKKVYEELGFSLQLL